MADETEKTTEELENEKEEIHKAITRITNKIAMMEAQKRELVNQWVDLDMQIKKLCQALEQPSQRKDCSV